MSQQMLMTLGELAGGFLIGLAVLWWLTSRLARPGWARAFIRVFTVLVLFSAVGIAGLTLTKNEAQAAVAATTLVVVESQPVQTGNLQITLDAVGSLAPIQQRTLSFGASAPVTQVLVKAGDQVHAGDVLAQLDATDAEAKVRSAQLSLQQAQAALDQLTAPPTALDVAMAQANVAVAQAALYSASKTGPAVQDVQIAQLQAELSKNQLWQTQLSRDAKVQQQQAHGSLSWVQTQQLNQPVSQAEDSVQLAAMSASDTASQGPDAGSLASANASLVSAQSKLATLKSGPTDSDVRRAQIAVQNQQLNLDTAQKALDDYKLIAPFDGVVAEEDLTPGVMPSAAPITLIDASQYTIDLSINEADVPNVAVGQAVIVKLQALNNAQATGKITSLDVTPTASGQLVTYTATVTLDPSQEALRPGMSSVATVILKSLENVIVVPNRFIHSDPTTQQSMVTVQTAPDTFQEVPVTIGNRSATDSEIVSGLTLGQTLVIRATAASQSAAQQRGGGLFGIPGAGGGGIPGGGRGGFPGGGGGFRGG